MASDIEHQSRSQEMEDGSVDVPESKAVDNPNKQPKPGAYWTIADIKSLTGTTVVILLVITLVSILVGVVLTIVAGCSLLGPLGIMIFYSIMNRDSIIMKKEYSVKLKNKGWGGIYSQSSGRLTIVERILKGWGSLLPRASLLLLFCLVLTTTAPSLKRVTLLGSPLWKWSLQSVTITSSYFVAVALYCLPSFLLGLVGLRIRVQYYYNGLMPSATFLVYSFILLLSWLLYFRTDDHGLKNPSNIDAFQYVTWTFVSLFVGSFLWLLKALLLLNWCAGVIYRRFQPRILITGAKYPCLALLIDGLYEENIIRQMNLDMIDQHHDKPPHFKPSKYIMSVEQKISDLEYVGHILTSLVQSLSTREEDGVSDVLQWFQDNINHDSNQECGVSDLVKLPPGCELPRTSRINILLLKPVVNACAKFKRVSWRAPDFYIVAKLLYQMAGEDRKSNEFTFDDLKKWMVDGHKECVNMGRTLSDAKAIVTRLDIFLSFIILVVGVFVWLLITGIATTAVLVTIATPLLALTFIFGDTAKAFFQGLIFCFATHPFDVGDRCILDQTQLEVKSMSILTTTFTNIESNEKVFYPNSILSTKAIVNLGWQPDPTDVVELLLASSISIENLENRINKFFSENNHNYEESHKVIIKEVGDNVKVIVNFKHILTVHDLTHSQCSHKKSDQRSYFLKVIKQFLNESRTSRQTDVNNFYGNNSFMPHPDSSRSTYHSTTSEIMEVKNI